ncbi:uncharacterized protein PpBr36_09975 [Pyricularia pennisetigena]|uniref:uncharacterized protein n=1 Tax=Pyricularia pennisetigena TaxID=1578925 RepID=UPI0011548AC0|nr:uncharacterized protein PpBr36_09975 [Pyricularia pennisetigena]TLS22209.1 hypothetical protein PpBr36_09975 [Pyricularia pennisetigena]
MASDSKKSCRQDLARLDVVAVRPRDSRRFNGPKACECRQAMSFFLRSDDTDFLTNEIDDAKFFTWLKTEAGFYSIQDALAFQTHRGSLGMTGICSPIDLFAVMDSVQREKTFWPADGKTIFFLIYEVATAKIPRPDGCTPEEAVLDLMDENIDLRLCLGMSPPNRVEENPACSSGIRKALSPSSLSRSSSSTSLSSEDGSSATTASSKTVSASSAPSLATSRHSLALREGKKPQIPSAHGKSGILARLSQPTASSSAKSNVPRVRALNLKSRPKPMAAIAPNVIATPRPADTIEVDAEYSAIDETNIDATLGSYNNDGNGSAWLQCLDLFCIDAVEYANREARDMQASKTGHLPVKKLHGSRGGLFDYQMSAVFQMLCLLRKGVRGGFLADEMGLGKSIEMLGIQSVLFSLRSMVEDIHVNRDKHSFSGPACKAEGRYMIRCPCYHSFSRELADLVLDGPTVIIAPTSTSEQMFQMTKQRLDPKVFELRLVGASAGTDGALSSTDMRALAWKSVKNPVAGEPDFRGGLFSQNKFVIVCPDSKIKELHKLMPGAVYMDEFHQYTQADKPVDRWLKAVQGWAAPEGGPPPFFFVGGTPIEKSPADIRPQLERLEQPSWSEGRMKVATVSALDSVISRYVELQQMQKDGIGIFPCDIRNYHVQLNEILRQVMIRRLATDSFRGRILALKPMRVNIHQVPVLRGAQDVVGACSNATRSTVIKQIGSEEEQYIDRHLDSDSGEELLERLRLASFFPQTAKSLKGKAVCSFLEKDIVKCMQGCKGGIEKSKYWDRVEEFTTNSAKLDTLKKLMHTMLDDKTQIPNEHCRAKKMCIITPTEGEALLIFAHLRQTRDSWKTGVKPKPIWLHSGMSSIEADEVVRAFKQKGNATSNILVAPLSRAGTGLDLPQANYLVLTGLGWRKRDNKQAFYRIHRAGQILDTHLHLIVSRGNPAERRIWARHSGGKVASQTAWKVFAENDTIPQDELPDAVKDAVGNVISEDSTQFA